MPAGWRWCGPSTTRPATSTPTSCSRPTASSCTACCCTPEGKRYGEELNGSRQSGWGDGQSRDFQQTAPFIALATDRPLAEAVREGLARGHAASAIPADTRAQQVAWWMRELIDVTLLDYPFSQQDRIGNVDYLPHWVWVEEGQVRHQPATGAQPPAEIATRNPKLIKRTELADNDAGVRLSYADQRPWRRAQAALADVSHAVLPAGVVGVVAARQEQADPTALQFGF
jgi:hypothetical protein